MDGQNKLNVHAQEFTMNRQELQNRNSIGLYPTGNILQHSKSNTNMQQQQQQMLSRHHAHALQQMANNMNAGGGGGGGPRPILVSHPMQIGHLGMGMAVQTSQMPLVNSPSSGNILHVSTILL